MSGTIGGMLPPIALVPDNRQEQGLTRSPNGQFLPGKSGNAGGRPKVLTDVRELARSYTAEAIEALAKTMRDEKAPHAAKVAAAIHLLDRAWGRAPQSVSIKPEAPECDAGDFRRALEAAVSITVPALVEQTQRMTTQSNGKQSRE